MNFHFKEKIQELEEKIRDLHRVVATIQRESMFYYSTILRVAKLKF